MGVTGRETILMKLDARATQSRPEAAMAAFAKSWRRQWPIKAHYGTPCSTEIV